MVRKMAYVGISYITGLFFASFFIPTINLLVAISFLLITTLYFFIFKKFKKEVLLVSFFFCIAIFSNVIYTKMVYEKILNYQGKDIKFTGVIEDYNLYEGEKASYQIKGKINDKVKATVTVYAPATDCKLYDTVYIEGKFSKLEDTLSFPAESYYKSKNIYLTSSDVKVFQVKKNNSFSVRKALNTYSEYIFLKITTILPEDEGAFIGAMLCGDTDYLSSDRQTNLFRSGIGHIISVSGSHLMIIAGILLLILKKFSINKWLRFSIIECVIIAYTFFTGLPISVIRSAIMFTILMLGDVAKRRIDCLTSIALAGMLLTITNPFAIRDSSLLLSLAGTFGITVFAPYVVRFLGFKGKLKGIKNALVSMLCVSVVTFPFVVTSFDEVSLISPIANLILAPLCSFALICALIIALTGGISIIAYPLLLLSGLAIKLMFFISDLLVKLPCSYIPIGNNYIIIILLLSIIGVLIISLYFKNTKALLSSILVSITIMIMSINIYSFINRDNLNIVLLSEKNSSSLVLNKKGQTFIIDMYGNGKISKVTSKYLNKQGIKSVDVLFLDDNSQKTVSSYYNNLSADIDNICFSDKQNVILPDNTNVTFYEPHDIIKSSDFQVEILDDMSYLITYNDFKLLATKNGSENDCDIKIEVLDKQIALSYDNEVLYLDTKTSNAILIKAQKNGDYSIRRMSNALRE